MMRWGLEGAHSPPKRHGSVAAESEGDLPEEGRGLDCFAPAPGQSQSSCT